MRLLDRRASRILLAVSGICALVCCRTLTPEGRRVRVTEDPGVRTWCVPLGHIEGSTDAARRNAVARLGGDTLLVRQWNARTGEAYRCVVEPGGRNGNGGSGNGGL